MSLDNDGRALILVYGEGRREAVLTHEHDGGEAYMGPLLRKAVQYAKTHYESGNIVDVLMSEGEMDKLSDAEIGEIRSKVRHIYYVTYKWDSEMEKKAYHVSAIHMKDNHHYPVEADLPELASKIPERALRMA
jgi:hypothetical protein